MIPSPPSDVSAILRRVRKIELVTRGLVRETIGGEYHSSFKGQGIDFDDFREYQPGDEVRSIDWNVTARQGTPFIKKFSEERELTVYLAVDISASGAFGSMESSKREMAAEIAALLAFSAIKNQDKVGLLLFSGGIDLYLPPRKGSRHILRIIREILTCEPKNPSTDLTPALKLLVSAAPRRALVFTISDFIAENYENALKIAAIKHDLVALQVQDPAETALPNLGRRHVYADAESNEHILFPTGSATARSTYAEAAAQWQSDLESTFRRHAIDHIRLRTGEDYIPALHAFFRGRSSRPA